MAIDLQGDYSDMLAARRANHARAVEHLYSVFKRYPLRTTVTGCPHCVFPTDNDRLHSKPLEKLTAHDLVKYAQKAVTTWGGVDDLRHFFPRLAELLTDHEFVSSVGPQVVA